MNPKWNGKLRCAKKKRPKKSYCPYGTESLAQSDPNPAVEIGLPRPTVALLDIYLFSFPFLQYHVLHLDGDGTAAPVGVGERMHRKRALLSLGSCCRL